VISDLPDKTESRRSARSAASKPRIYQQAVKTWPNNRRDKRDTAQGLVLAFLMRFKQICNHPSQWLGDGAWGESDSGKWGRLREIAEVVAARQEKMLVFTHSAR